MDQIETNNIAPDRVIISQRVFNSPLATVFKAWTDPMHLAKWWGPKGFTNTFHEYDLQPGGHWKFTMHGPENGHYENECVFMEIVPNTKLHWDRISKPHFQVLVNFSEERNGTKVVFNMIFNTVEESDKLRNFVPEKNEENFDRLEEELSKM
ncbi:MAG: SRPBCC family protein [Sediminibacterium sp.]